MPRQTKEQIAAKFIAMKPEFDFGRDQDGDKVTDTKFCMVSEGEWRQIRVLASSILPRKRRP